MVSKNLAVRNAPPAGDLDCVGGSIVDKHPLKPSILSFAQPPRMSFADRLSWHLSALHSAILDEHEQLFQELQSTHVENACECGPCKTDAHAEADETLLTDQPPVVVSGGKADLALVSVGTAADAEDDASNSSQPDVTVKSSLKRVRRSQERLIGDSEIDAESDAVRSGSTFTAKHELMFKMLSTWTDNPDFLNMQLHEPRATLRKHSRISWDYATAHAGVFDDGDVIAQHVVIHPYSQKKRIWIVICFLLLLYDVILVPVEVCFAWAKDDRRVFQIIDIVSTVIWTLDIPLTFCTGLVTVMFVDMRMRHIAKHYLKTWFFFDVFIVLPDYAAHFAEGFPGSHVALLRMARWGRFMRLMRVARVAKLSKFSSVIHYLACRYRLSKMFVRVTQGVMATQIMILASLHLMACLWRGVSSFFDNGWVRANHLEAASITQLYVVSFHWACSRLLGLSSHNVVEAPPELVFDSILMLWSVAMFSTLVSTVTVTLFVRTTSKPLNLWTSSISYSRRHCLLPETEVRLAKAIEATYYQSLGEIYEEELELLKAVPESLQEDLLFEVREPCLLRKQIFKDMVHFNERVVRHLCFEAISAQCVVVFEVVFQKGFAGKFMRFISQGCLAYTLTDCMEYQSGHEEIQNGACLSEAVLWTQWEHCGAVQAKQASLILALDATSFAKVVKDTQRTHIHAVRYAKHFVWRLNREAPFIDDLTSFEDLDVNTLNDSLFDGSLERHFAFISHYKAEAGTEATLIAEELSQVLHSDVHHEAHRLKHPIFIDSESLTDLKDLKLHVMNSDILMLLLTPDLLTRPWCLVEISTAIKYKASIVLVEIQRPGYRFHYPDKEFYDNLRAGRLFDANAVSLFEKEGINLEDVEYSLRRTFLKVALPFSPHKSRPLRKAEMREILRRCSLELENDRQTSKESIDSLKMDVDI